MDERDLKEHEDNLFLMNNEDKIRREIRDKYEEK